ncbi:hypothetical protein H5410_055990 [Solanum commersonii]|uniref:Uncharacterized protein n=1 Tax=Solanum commersonii TaxID=4109 RepID=A0A9J5WLE8_SOLCO|nr:hypothetical protein H5410_055990 [Solanum commersonii]
MKSLENCNINIQSSAKLKWDFNSKGLYTVKAGYEHLSSNKMMIDLWPWKFIPFKIGDAYTSRSSMEVRKSIRKIWIMTPACIFWCFSNERNRTSFDGVITPIFEHKASCLVNLFSCANSSPVNN